MKDSLLVSGVLLLGIILGVLFRVEITIDIQEVTTYSLYTLLLCVGFGIGHDRTFIERIRQIHPLFFMLPLLTIVTTLLGSAAASWFLPHRTVAECMAVGSGMGYYSLSSILITQIKGVELGVVALISNVIREVFVFIFAVQLARYFGKATPICCVGAASMDSALPFVARACGAEFIIISLMHGILVDFSVPFLVTFFCNY